MPDITKCSNDKCPKKSECWRYVSKPSGPYQSYGEFQPDNKGICSKFWRIDPSKKATKP